MKPTNELATMASAGPARILIADDEAMNRKLFRRLLEPQGYVILDAEDGQQALDKAITERPDVILLDVMMPGKSGLEVCQQLKTNRATAPIPILMITGSDDHQLRVKGVAAGADDFLNKPVDQEEFILRVRNAAYRKQLYDELARKYAELKAMAELHDQLANIIEEDTAMLAEQIQKASLGSQPAAAETRRAEEGQHGTD